MILMSAKVHFSYMVGRGFSVSWWKPELDVDELEERVARKEQLEGRVRRHTMDLRTKDVMLARWVSRTPDEKYYQVYED